MAAFSEYSGVSGGQKSALLESFGSEIVTLRVGPAEDSSDIFVHQQTLTKASKFFRTAIEHNWKESETRIILLPEDDPNVVAIFSGWLYSERIDEAHPRNIFATAQACFALLVQLYIFGEKIQHDAFCDAIMSRMVSRLSVSGDTYPPAPARRRSNMIALFKGSPTGVKSSIQTLYEGTPKGSPARRFAVDLQMQLGVKDWIGDKSSEHHPDFLLDLCRAMADIHDQPKPGSTFEVNSSWLKSAQRPR